MYKGLIRPILFLFDAEKVHRLVVFLVRIITYISPLKKIIRNFFNYKNPVLKTKIGELVFENKVGMAAGFDKNADFYDPFSIWGFSFFEIGTVTPMAQPGNPKPRIFRLKEDKALINRMGFNNKGVHYAANRLKNRDKKLIVGGNIGKNTSTSNINAADDYEKCFVELYEYIDYFTVNVSCPNIKDLSELQDQNSLKIILERIMKVRSEKSFYRPVFLKISPDLTFKHIDEILNIYYQTGLDGIIATNTTTDRECLKTNKTDVLDMGPGGLSGLPLKKRSLEIVRYICKQSNFKIPVIGVGGIINENDAIEMIEAGASLIQIYTGFIYEGPFIVKRLNKAIAKHLMEKTK